MRYVIAPAEDLAPGDRRVVTLGGRSIGIFNVGGTYYAVRNRCPHQGGPLAQGAICAALSAEQPGRYRDDPARPILRCPWHGWEFDLATGGSWFDPTGTRVRRYDVSICRPGAISEAGERDPVHQPPDSVETYPVECESGVIVVEV